MGDVCAKCGGTFHVQQFSPDMDIRPVALCMVCLMGMVTGAGNIHDLIDRPSLGTQEAKAARETVPTEVAAEVVRRSMEG